MNRACWTKSSTRSRNPNQCLHSARTVGQFLVLGLLVYGEVKGVENAAGITDVAWGQLVGCEDGVLADTAGVHNVVVSPALNLQGNQNPLAEAADAAELCRAKENLGHWLRR